MTGSEFLRINLLIWVVAALGVASIAFLIWQEASSALSISASMGLNVARTAREGLTCSNCVDLDQRASASALHDNASGRISISVLGGI